MSPTLPPHILDQLRYFRPFPVGDTVGTLDTSYYFPWSTPWLWTVPVFLLTLTLAILVFPGKHNNPNRRLAKAIAKSLLLVLLPTAFTIAVGMAAIPYWGGPFFYANYRVPATPADVVIWFAGSDDGAYGVHFLESNYGRAYFQFGYNRTALFNFSDLDKALHYARQLPMGSRLIVRGHSMGAATAVHFALQTQHKIILLDTRDATSWFNKINKKPQNVLYWRNILPQTTSITAPAHQFPTSNYIGPFNMANVFRLLGRPWGHCDGATNIILPNNDHHTTGNNLPQDHPTF